MRIATDIGGTFTDLVSISDEGNIITGKAHTTAPNYEKGVLDVIQQSGLGPETIDTFIHGSTVVINALTERSGAKTGLITTKGFRDVLEIARGNRPDLFNLRYKKPTPFVDRYLRQEVQERLNFKGEVITPLDKDAIRQIAAYFKKEKVEAVAIAYLYSYINPEHEVETKKMIKELLPDVAVTASHEVTKEWREYERTNTAVLNAYVKPTASTYLTKLKSDLHHINLNGYKYVMQSNGGTTTFPHAEETPINVVESGPVAGVYGAAVLGELIGEKNIIAFDIGGTTAKCSLIDNGEMKVDTNYFIEKDDKHAGYPIKVPVVDIIEIGNGGGSIAWIDKAGSLKVGPKSAGSSPGPVAYGKGGEQPTTTDANLLTGRLSLSNFDSNVEMDTVKQAIQEKVANTFEMTADEAALGIIRIANSNMLQALKMISVRKGYDPRDFTLIAYGGGGALHAPALAKELGIGKVIIPNASAVFSAWGMLMTDLRHDYIQTFINEMGQIDPNTIDRKWDKLEASATEQFAEEGITEEHVLFSKFVDMRYKGQEHTVKVPYPDGTWNDTTKQQLARAFHELHEKKYTYKLENTEMEFVNLHLTALGTIEKPKVNKFTVDEAFAKNEIKEKRQVLYEEIGWTEVNVYHRGKLPTGYTLNGPAIVEEPTSSTILYPDQQLQVDDYGNLIIRIKEAEA
ncbi:hydantoinase/oxoprolinase family protein [Virgibacillus dakarensis]|uniref:5-oxoprolinase n=1 Tax=Lentibacillus populi TaxID=1827502 RepID=A0A9W5TYY2_9BACI|nr:hydantoinase/oxoprolinase family protein [Lentibacillus populi]MTW87211.1 hydantoinase/oxoprolinase family protein [Virgibacillus dakarensis]GGB48114.1 5-oxoprolinase [Lentibacillus populi]